MRCPGCGSDVSSRRLACPVCHHLLHRERLEALAATARQAVAAGRLDEALTAWRDALELLPPGSKQHTVILATVRELSQKVEASHTRLAGDRRAKAGWWKSGAGVASAGALLVWKLKGILVVLLGKGKLLLAGLAKAPTLFSMLLSLGVYWAAWGWQFAFGLVLSIYVHEMGHVAALQRLGIRATAPMFVPGLGAFVRLQQRPADPREDAIIGLGGPIFGLGAAIVPLLVFWAGGPPIWGGIAKFGAWINLFNLLPVWQLDGGRAYRALSRRQRWPLVALTATLWIFTREGLLVLLTLAGAFRAFGGEAPAAGDRRTLIEIAILLSALSAIAALELPLSLQ